MVLMFKQMGCIRSWIIHEWNQFTGLLELFGRFNNGYPRISIKNYWIIDYA